VHVRYEKEVIFTEVNKWLNFRSKDKKYKYGKMIVLYINYWLHVGC